MPSTLVLTVGPHSLLGIQSLTSGFSFFFPPSCRPWSISGGWPEKPGAGSRGMWGREAGTEKLKTEMLKAEMREVPSVQ